MGDRPTGRENWRETVSPSWHGKYNTTPSPPIGCASRCHARNNTTRKAETLLPSGLQLQLHTSGSSFLRIIDLFLSIGTDPSFYRDAQQDCDRRVRHARRHLIWKCRNCIASYKRGALPFLSLLRGMCISYSLYTGIRLLWVFPLPPIHKDNKKWYQRKNTVNCLKNDWAQTSAVLKNMTKTYDVSDEKDNCHLHPLLCTVYRSCRRLIHSNNTMSAIMLWFLHSITRPLRWLIRFAVTCFFYLCYHRSSYPYLSTASPDFAIMIQPLLSSFCSRWLFYQFSISEIRIRYPPPSSPKKTS